MKLRKILMIFFAVLSYLSLGVCIYGICYETLDAFSLERAKYFFDLTPYVIQITAVAFIVFAAISVVLYKSVKKKK